MLQLDPTSALQSGNKSIDSSPNGKGSKSKGSGRWTKEEHQRFIDGLKRFGKNWKLVEDHVGTRNGAQIRSHAQKFFLRLEKEFDLRFEDFDTQTNKKKFEETLKKLSETGYGNEENSSEAPEKAKLSAKLEKNLTPVQEKIGRGFYSASKDDTAVPSSMRTSAMSLSNSPKLDHFEQPQLRKRPSRKMSEDILHASTSHSLFDIIISKLRAGETDHRITSPQLSDFVDFNSSRKSSFNAPDLKTDLLDTKPQGFVNSSFRLNMRKMSEDNVLVNLDPLSRLRRPEMGRFDDVELITKKFKVN